MKLYNRISKSFPAFFVVIVVLGSCVCSCSAKKKNSEESLQLQKVADVPLSGGNSRFDYQSIDPITHCLYIAHLGADRVTVFDLQTQKVITDVLHIARPHGLIAVPELHRVYVSATGDDQVVVIDEASLEVVKRIPVGHYPDGLAFDPVTKKIFVSDESGRTVSVINTETNEFVTDIAMGGDVGNTQYDPVSKHIFSAVQTRDELAEIDPTADTIIARYKLPGCKHPHGFFIDPQTHYALITGEGNDKMVVFDLNSKTIISNASVGGDPDVLAFDSTLHRLYVSAESGVISIFTVEKDSVKKANVGFLAKAAHSVSVDENTHRVYFPLEDIDGSPVLRIMQPLH
ncbi:MAG TPA: YncE family protein [Candidatus Kapabacteria bacterium]|nr:YncE family protein [Candidatus Kapabacteria bacterium]